MCSKRTKRCGVTLHRTHACVRETGAAGNDDDDVISLQEEQLLHILSSARPCAALLPVCAVQIRTNETSVSHTHTPVNHLMTNTHTHF